MNKISKASIIISSIFAVNAFANPTSTENEFVLDNTNKQETLKTITKEQVSPANVFSFTDEEKISSTHETVKIDTTVTMTVKETFNPACVNEGTPNSFGIDGKSWSHCHKERVEVINFPTHSVVKHNLR